MKSLVKSHVWRVGSVAAAVVGALAAGVLATPAVAQEERRIEEAPAADDDLAAETAYLKAYFAEKEKRDFAGADTAYAAVAAMPGASREIVGRALLGRARCLRALKRDADATTMLENVRTGYADAVPASELAALAPPGAGTSDLGARIVGLLRVSQSAQVAEYGDRAIPHVERVLRWDVPGTVRNAATTLRLIGSAEAWKALTNGLLDPAVQFPRQLAAAAFDRTGDFATLKPEPLAAVRAALAHADPEVRRTALAAAVLGDGRLPGDLVAAILGDPVHLGAVCDEEFGDGERWGQIVVTALASPARDLRDRALAVVKEWSNAPTSYLSYLDNPFARPFFDPPAALLDDPEAFALVLDRVYRRTWVETARPSAELLAKLAATPEAADLAATWMLCAPTAPRFEPAAFARAVSISAPGRISWSKAEFLVPRLAQAAAGPGREQVLAAMSAHWRWGDLLPRVLAQMEADKTLDALALRALGSAVVDSRTRQQVLGWLKDSGGAAAIEDPPGFRVRDELLAAAVADADPQVAAAALQALRAAMKSGGTVTFPEASLDRFLAGKDPALAAAAIAFVASRGEEGLATLASHLQPDHPQAVQLLQALASSKDPSLDARIAAVVLQTRTNDAATSATKLLVSRKGKDAEPILAEAIASDATPAKHAIVRALVESRRHLGADASERLLVLVFEKVPETLFLPVPDPDSANAPALVTQSQAERKNVLDSLPVEAQLRVLRAALGSRAAQVRKWAAWATAETVGEAGWDDLLRAAEDPDGEVRRVARFGLTQLEASRSEMDRLRSAGQTRALRDRVESLLAAKDEESRRAGIAAIVATRGVDRIPDLLRLAVEDPSPDVRTDARAALMSLGSSGATAAPTRMSPDSGEK